MTKRKKIIVGVWKAYLTKDTIKEITTGLKKWRIVANKKFDYNIVLAPSHPYLQDVKNMISDTDILLCAQDTDLAPMGTVTGHVPPEILADVGCEYVILGHSELRNLKEQDQDIIKEKVKTTLNSGLKVILCIGETNQQKEEGETCNVLKNQIESALDDLDPKSIKNNFNIAYEPVWAISSQDPVIPPTAAEIAVINKKIRSIIEKKLDKKVADTVRLLYGGSVNAENVCSYLNESDADGVMVGSASTELEHFIGLLDAVENKVMLPE